MNEEIIKYILGAVVMYLYGAVPFSLLVGLIVYKTDIRTTGSKNIGGTNLGRACGKKAFALGFILDGSKGALAVLLGYLLGINPIFLFFFALLGHTYSVFVKFKGGKGVATAFGFVLAYSPIGAIIAISAFLIILIITKYVSLSSILAILVYVIYTFFDPRLPNYFSIVAVAIWLIVVLLHRKNIVRLFKGEESKIGWI